MLSNKLTFSLASLVVLIAFGLIFAMVPVMADDPVLGGADGITPVGNHPAGTEVGAGHVHPTVMISVPDDPTTTDVNESVDPNIFLDGDPDVNITVEIRFVVGDQTVPVTIDGTQTISIVGLTSINGRLGTAQTSEIAVHATKSNVYTATIAAADFSDFAIPDATDANRYTQVVGASGRLAKLGITVERAIATGNVFGAAYDGQANTVKTVALAVIPQKRTDPTTVTITPTEVNVDGEFDLTLTFTAAPAAFVAANIAVIGGTVKTLTPIADGTAKVFTATITPQSGVSEVIVTITGPGTGSATITGELTPGDVKSRVLSVAAEPMNVGANQTFVATITFAAAVAGTVAAPPPAATIKELITIVHTPASGATPAGTGAGTVLIVQPTPNPLVFSATIQPTMPGSMDVGVDKTYFDTPMVATGATDPTVATVVYDMTAPTVESISRQAVSVGAGVPATVSAAFFVRITLSEKSTNFTKDDVEAKNATVTALVAASTDGMEYDATITPTLASADDIVVSVENGSFSDAAGNKYAAPVMPATPVEGTDMLTVAVDATKVATPGTGEKIAGTVPLSGAIAANGFVVIAPAATGHGIETVTPLTGLDINLEQFFLNGGKILLKAPATTTSVANHVVISEIMWGRDDALAPRPTTHSQWIELYNTGAAIASLTGWYLEFLGPNSISSEVGTVIDTVTNLGPVGFWSVVGQSGRSDGAIVQGVALPAQDIISMYRNIDYTKVEKGDHDTDATKNRATQLEGVPDGTIAGSWKASVRPSVNLGVFRVGTPGAKHIIRLSSDPTVLTQSVLINEVGNGTGDSNDWVEILNTTGSEINLKKWELTLVTGTDATDKKEVALVSFPDNDDTKLPANGILLITQSDPTASGNDLAAGVQINVKAEDQVKRGLSSLYYISADLKLPDDGKFLLVMRNANDKEGKVDNIIDAGGVTFLLVSDTTHNTQVWPLQATAKGHTNVIEAADEALASGQVYQRAGKNSGIGEKHWKKIGFTGIGYDRRAASNDSNGGTPGYANDARKEKVADLTAGDEITISEIMVDAGGGRRKLPQWIELYNASMTQAVNLNEWKLDIQNANTQDVDARLNATITLGEMTIAPNQTVIIVTTSGLNSGSDHFPGTRLVNLWTTTAHREALEMSARNDRVLSSTGFYLQLTDKDKKVVDEAGNLDGDRKTADDPAWALPMSSEEGRRASLIRVYQEGVAIDGTTAAGWVGASDTSLAFAISHTYYGSADDFGTPGFRGGGPLPVSLSSFRPERDKATGNIVVRWVTESELDNAGFNILRSETKNGEYKVVNLKGIVPGHGTTSEKHVYEWKDTTAKPNVVYYYQIEDVSLDGKRTTLATTRLKGHVSAAGKATLTWGEIKGQ